MAGFIKYMRTEEAEFLLSYPNANHLFQVMAFRARRTDHPMNGLKAGQCFLGDFKKIGLTERQYRTAKKQLTEWSLATFKGTNKGTVGTILNSKVYDINEDAGDRQETDKRQTGDGQATTNKECKKEIMEEVTSLVPAKPKPKSKFKFNDDDFALAEWMLGRVKVINPSAKEPNLSSWANTIRLMRDVNNYDHRQIVELFDWANKDSFWCSNILSPDKLRKQWDKLNAKRLNNHEGYIANKGCGGQPTESIELQKFRAAKARRDASRGRGMEAMGDDDQNVLDLDSSQWSGTD